MAVANKTVISFGLVAIPIAMYTAVQENDISFNQLHKEDNSRIRYRKGIAGKKLNPMILSRDTNMIKTIMLPLRTMKSKRLKLKKKDRSKYFISRI